VNTRA